MGPPVWWAHCFSAQRIDDPGSGRALRLYVEIRRMIGFPCRKQSGGGAVGDAPTRFLARDVSEGSRRGVSFATSRRAPAGGSRLGFSKFFDRRHTQRDRSGVHGVEKPRWEHPGGCCHRAWLTRKEARQGAGMLSPCPAHSKESKAGRRHAVTVPGSLEGKHGRAPACCHRARLTRRKARQGRRHAVTVLGSLEGKHGSAPVCCHRAWLTRKEARQCAGMLLPDSC